MCGGHDNVNITKKCIQSENEEPKNPPAYVCGGMKNTTLPANAPKVKVKIWKMLPAYKCVWAW